MERLVARSNALRWGQVSRTESRPKRNRGSKTIRRYPTLMKGLGEEAVEGFLVSESWLFAKKISKRFGTELHD
jgi:hypothetical protein